MSTALIVAEPPSLRNVPALRSTMLPNVRSVVPSKVIVPALRRITSFALASCASCVGPATKPGRLAAAAPVWSVKVMAEHRVSAKEVVA